MMSTITIEPLSPDLVLPWTPNAKQEALFKKWVRNTLVVLLLLFVVIPWLPVFEAEYEPAERKIVKTKVILEAVKLPKPEAIVVKPKTPKKIKPKPVEKKKKSDLNKATKASSKTSSKKRLTKSKSLSELSSQLSALRGSINVAGMKNKKVVQKRKGMVATVDRNVLGENRTAKASMGVSVDDNLMKSSSVALTGHQTSEVAGVISTGQGAGAGGGSSERGNYVAGRRDDESIRRTMDRNKGRFNSLYQNRLGEYPEIHGKFIFNLVIEPDGRISRLELILSELGLTDLEEDLLKKIKGINFGVADVLATPVQYTYVFFPS